MIYAVRHSTRVTYAAPISQAQFNIRLEPWPWAGQVLHRFVLDFDPVPDMQSRRSGPYGVNTCLIGYQSELVELALEAHFTIAVAPVVPAHQGPDLGRIRQEALESRDLSALGPAPYLFASRIADADFAIGQWAGGYLRSHEPGIATVRNLMRAIHSEFAYRPGVTSSATPPAEAFARREGVCQDFAHIMIVALRSHGIPAAYVSGYLRTVPPPGKLRLVGADAMHAWVNVWCGAELGWVGFDPTNDCLALEDHILIGMGRDYADVSPIDGIFLGNAPQAMTTAVDVVGAVQG